MNSSPNPDALSAAAVEVMQSVLHFLPSIGQTARGGAEANAIQTLVACRCIELLEIYIRRVLELIFAHDKQIWATSKSDRKVTLKDALTLPREELIALAREQNAKDLAGKFEDAHKVLGQYLGCDPFTHEQLKEFIRLKEQRNLFVHNNGIVDYAYAQKYPEYKPGEQIESTRLLVFGSGSLLTMVRHIDALLLSRYPQLATDATDLRNLFAESMTRTLQAIGMTAVEAAKFNEIAPQLQNMSGPFNLGALIPEGSQAGLETVWAFTETDDSGIQAISYDGKVVSGFPTLAEAQEFVAAEVFPWEDFEIQSQNEQTTIAVSGPLVLLCPTNQWKP